MKPEGGAQQVSSMPEVSADKNLMPSVVARQQRLHSNTKNTSSTSNSSNINNNSNYNNSNNKSNPSDDDGLKRSPLNTAFLLASAHQSGGTTSQQASRQEFDQDGLIIPKRVLHHPTSVAQPIIRDLNRELKFNQIRGKNVLDQKSELKKALEKLGENRRKKELEKERLNRRTSLELRLEERAERLAQGANSGPESHQANSEGASSATVRGFTIRSMVDR